MDKKQITQDELRDFIKAHNLKRARIADVAGLSEGSVTSCLNHQVINQGVPRSFTAQTVERMNEELPKMAEAIASCVMEWGTDSKELKRVYGVEKYDKALVIPIREKVAYFFNINPFLFRVVGWTVTKKHNVLETNTGKAHGNITREEMNRINDELEFVSQWLLKRELVADEASSDSQSSSTL